MRKTEEKTKEKWRKRKTHMHIQEQRKKTIFKRHKEYIVLPNSSYANLVDRII